MSIENQAKNSSDQATDGHGGSVFIISKNISGSGKISADGGNGVVPGHGGKIEIISDNHQFAGEISAKGGKQIGQHRKWWETSCFQIIALVGSIIGMVAFIYQLL